MKKKQMKQKIENLKLAVLDQADTIDALNNQLVGLLDQIGVIKARAFDLLTERG